MNNLFDVTDEVVLITGSSRGLGLKLAEGFIEAGARVIINGRDSGNVKKVVEKFKKAGSRVYSYPFDVTDYEQVKKNVQEIEKDVGPINILINNAGIQKRAPLEELSIAQWKEVIEVNLNAIFYLSRTTVQFMKERKRGKIINITSINAEGARPTIGNYCAAKGGLKMLTKSMATEWGKYNIQTNAIGPGYFKTDMTRELVNDPEFDKWVKSEVPLRRWGNPSELIGSAIFLASEASNYINGHTIYVDGGWLASL